jgi:hypothetical protein
MQERRRLPVQEDIASGNTVAPASRVDVHASADVGSPFSLWPWQSLAASLVLARALLHDGVNPLEAKREAGRATAKHAAQWAMTLRRYAQSIKGRPIDAVDTEAVLEVLKPLWRRVSETAERLRGRIENVLHAARVRGYRSGENPARLRGHLDQLLPKRQRLTRGHHAASHIEASSLESTDALDDKTMPPMIVSQCGITTCPRPASILRCFRFRM